MKKLNSLGTATRRQILLSGTAALALAGCSTAMPKAPAAFSGSPRTDGKFAMDWSESPDRVFLGGEVWANPMEDWQVKGGAAVMRRAGGARNIQILTHQLTAPAQQFEMHARVTRHLSSGHDSGIGFKVGVRSDLNEFRSNVFAKNGMIAGVKGDMLVLGKDTQPLSTAIPSGPFQLALKSEIVGGAPMLTLTAMDDDGAILGSMSSAANPRMLLGNVSLMANFAVNERKSVKSKYSVHSLSADGPAFTVNPDHSFGPIMWSMYAVSDSRSAEGHVFKLSVLTAPMGPADNKDVELQIKRKGSWQSLGTAELDTDAWTAVFRIANWDASQEYPYRVIYKSKALNGSETPHEWTGTIQAEPKGRPLRLAALTCQKDYGFPYEPVANNVAAMKPDLVYFSGDQIYENHGGFGIVRDPADLAILSYLRKYYQHGWAFRDVMRNAPTLCIPDDHDVFQGNYWGEGGAKMNVPDDSPAPAIGQSGGYREPVRMVNAVHRSTSAHHPDFYDSTPAKRDMSVYYGDMVYGDVGFAILGDRQFKNGPEHVETGPGRPDHVLDADFDTTSLDKPGLQLLGERQETFLSSWSNDWRGHSMKVLLSQTLFANTATHHGPEQEYVKGDLDSGGWPQAGRNRALDIIRPSKCLHVNGDQHLTTLCQYGVKEQRDSTWSFCTPAIAAGYPRSWLPDEVGMPYTDRPTHGHANTGAYRDGFENLVYVQAVGNPEMESLKNRYDVAHQKGSGFGFVLIDPATKTYEIESYRFLIDVNDPPEKNQFPGWPVTLGMDQKLIKS